MLFSNTIELQQIFPSSDIKKIEPYLSSIEDEQIQTLLPLVGSELLDQLEQDYAAIIDKHGGIWSLQITHAELTKEDSTRLAVVRTAQKICAYAFFAHKLPQLQVKLNNGGGTNVAYTDGYSAPDADDNKRLDTSLWRSCIRQKEQLLTILERDARTTKVYTTLWQQSDYYYQHSDLLFTTMQSLAQYNSLGETPFLEYNRQIQTQRDCIAFYIVGAIGQGLLDAVIGLSRRNSENSESSETKNVNSATQENLSSLSDISDLPRLSALKKHLQQSLATFMRYESTGNKDEHLRNLAQMHLTLATTLVRQNYSTFSQYINEGDPLYQPPVSSAAPLPIEGEMSAGQRGSEIGSKVEPGDVVFSLL